MPTHQPPFFSPTSFKFHLFELLTCAFSEGTNYCFCCCSDYKVVQVLRSCFQHFSPWALWHLVHSFAGCEVFWISCCHRVWGSCSWMACGKEHWEIIKDQYCESEWRIPHLKWGSWGQRGWFHGLPPFASLCPASRKMSVLYYPSKCKKDFLFAQQQPSQWETVIPRLMRGHSKLPVYSSELFAHNDPSQLPSLPYYKSVVLSFVLWSCPWFCHSLHITKYNSLLFLAGPILAGN